MFTVNENTDGLESHICSNDDCRFSSYNESADIHASEKSCFYNFAATKQASIAGYVDEPTSDFIMSL